MKSLALILASYAAAILATCSAVIGVFGMFIVSPEALPEAIALARIMFPALCWTVALGFGFASHMAFKKARSADSRDIPPNPAG